MPEEETDADDIGLALHRTAEVFTPRDRGELVRGGLANGRRRSARRRAAGVTTSVLLAAAVGVGGAYGGGLLGDDSAGASTEAAPPYDIAHTTATTLRKLLPHGTFTSADVPKGSGAIPGSRLSGVFDDGKGKAALSFSLSRTAADEDDATKCPDKGLATYDHCQATTLPDGSKITILQGYEYPDKREPTKSWYAEVLTPAGTVVNLQEWNAPAEKGAKVSRTDPPLTPAQLKAVVTAEDWNSIAARLPKPPQPPAPPKVVAKLPNGNELRKTLKSLLPAGIKVTGQDTSDDGGYTYLLVDDGKGVTRLEINVQPDMGDVEGQLFGSGGPTLPGGTQLVTHKDPGEKGGTGMLLWQADTIRPDGLRVVVMESNGEQQSGPATRPKPALTIDQLSAIATSKTWLTYLKSDSAG